MAAKILLGDPRGTKQTNFSLKQRSVDLHVNDSEGEKPAFSYIGPDVEKLSSLDEYKYLKDVEVTRPGSNPGYEDGELKKKMEAHLA
ncbi:hypothetical protein EB796_023826 [Bugula neritina]|uniref:Uncharacterized protein n=1 Tax=Bugula neritina TaxID=10212 RepID=A0A7J7IVA1_BUGNE|nr:hypothetical protein EB796_023826 [Bugula neritina]